MRETMEGRKKHYILVPSMNIFCLLLFFEQFSFCIDSCKLYSQHCFQEFTSFLPEDEPTGSASFTNSSAPSWTFKHDPGLAGDMPCTCF